MLFRSAQDIQDASGAQGISVTEEEQLKLDWELDKTESSPTTITLSGTFSREEAGSGDWTATYTYSPLSETVTEYDSIDRMKKRTTTDYSILAEVNQSYVKDYISYFGDSSIGNTRMAKIKEETVTYKLDPPIVEQEVIGGIPQKERGYDEVISNTSITYEHPLSAWSGTPALYVDSDTNTFEVEIGRAHV